MIPLALRVDVKPVVGMLGNVAKQVPFATAIALNRTMDDAQIAMKRGVEERFRLRSAQSRTWLLNTIYRGPGDRATKDNLRARIQVPEDRNVLARFEEGGLKTVKDPTFPFAIPTRAIRAFFGGTVDKKLLPKNLGLIARRNITGGFDLHAKGKSRKAGFHTTGTGKVQLKGRNRTFVVTLRSGHQGILQRTGPDRGNVRLIWAFRLQITDPPLLHFQATLRRVVAERWTINWNGAMAYAIATAR